MCCLRKQVLYLLQFGELFSPYSKYCSDQKHCTEYMKARYADNDLFKTFVVVSSFRSVCLTKLNIVLYGLCQKVMLYFFIARKTLKTRPTCRVWWSARCGNIKLQNTRNETETAINKALKFLFYIKLLVGEKWTSCLYHSGVFLCVCVCSFWLKNNVIPKQRPTRFCNPEVVMLSTSRCIVSMFVFLTVGRDPETV